MPETPTTTPNAPAASAARRIAWAVVLLATLALIASIVLLGRAIADHQRREGTPQYYYKPLDDADFTIAGRPVRVTEEVDNQGQGQLIVTYAQDTLRLNVSIPNPNPLPLMLRHEDWFRIFVWADGTGMNAREFEEARRTGQRPEHVVIVTRALGPGAPAGSWGDIWKDEWVFHFHTLIPPPADAPPDVGGGFAHEWWQYPESPKSYGRRLEAARAAGQPPPPRDPRDLVEGTWQYGAAMLVMPPQSAPPYAFNRGVLIANRAYVAVASVSILAIMIGLAVALAPVSTTRRERHSWSQTGP